jgi:hypothetical protein
MAGQSTGTYLIRVWVGASRPFDLPLSLAVIAALDRAPSRAAIGDSDGTAGPVA